MQRGGNPEGEIAHSQVLLDGGAEDIWGWATPAGQERVRARVDWIVSRCRLAPGARALECGCGTGMFTRRIAESGADIVAVDIAEDLLAEARRQCRAENVEFRQTNLERPVELEDASFDAVYGISVLHHLKVEAALPEIFRKLKPGGRFAFSEPNMSNPINKYVIFTDDQEKRRQLGVSPTEMAFYARELGEVIQRAGFEIESLRYRDFMHPRVPGTLIPLVKAGQWLAERTPLLRRWTGSLWVCGTRPH
jgi:ubiquinone/menaquinone biosynthesis C-methylase UbiE